MNSVGGRVAVIGAGSIGRRHVENLERLGERAELIRWRDFDPTALRKRRDIEALVIATATPVRLELVRFCAERNWPFYCEKPLAWRTAQVREIYEAAAPVAERSMAGFMMRYHPALQSLAARNLSDIFGYFLEIGHDVRQWRRNWRFVESYAALAEGGGVLLDLCHELDMAQVLFPGSEVVSCSALGHAAFPGVDFAVHLQLTAPDGPVGTVAMDYISPVSTRRMSLRGGACRVDVDFLSSEMWIVDGSGPQSTSYPVERNDLFLAAMRDFLALVRGKAISDNPLVPRFDWMRESCMLIASAWQARKFRGNVAMDVN